MGRLLSGSADVRPIGFIKDQAVHRVLFKQPVALGFGPAVCPKGKAIATPNCRSVAPPCNLMCIGLNPQERSVCVWRKVHAGQSLYQQGEAAHAIFAVRSGTFKSTLTLNEGSARICAFPMAGDVIALDGLGRATYTTTMTALDDAHVCAIARVPRLHATEQDSDMQGRLEQLMGDEILRTQKVLVLMGKSTAQDRLGVFLMDLSRRHRAQGYSGRDFTLRMTRADIGSFLGMALETVSRNLAGMQAQGDIEIAKRRVQIPDLETFSKRYGAWL